MRSFKTKIVLASSAVMILVLALATFSYFQFNKVHQDVTEMTKVELKKLMLHEELSLTINHLVDSANEYLHYGNPDDFSHYQDNYKNIKKKLKQFELTNKMENNLEYTNKWLTGMEMEVFPLYREGKKEKAIQTFTSKYHGDSENIVASFETMATNLEEEIISIGSTVAATSKVQKRIVLLLSLFTIGAGILTAVYIGNIVVRPLLLISMRMNKLADGDLTGEPIQSTSKDEIGLLTNATNQFSSIIKTLVSQVKNAVEYVTQTSRIITSKIDQSTKISDDVTRSIDDIVVDTDKQVSAVEEGSEAIKKINADINRLKDFADEVSNFSIKVEEDANQGNEYINITRNQMDLIKSMVDQTSSDVSKLGDQSQEIENIVKVITDIAAQTNLLALNATIEASRAGEHGKGFSVVAEEVRNLAEQSRRSAEMIGNLIENVQVNISTSIHGINKGTEEVERGLVITEKTSKAFLTILTSAETLTKHIVHIKQIIDGISSNSKMIDKKITNIDKFAVNIASKTQQISTVSKHQLEGIDELSALSEQLDHMSTDLNELISHFELSDTKNKM